jgi:uncharacterized protein YjbJ (UPF0337 family)
MSEDLVSEPFNSASEQVEGAHQQAVTELKDKVAKAKAAALKKVAP